MESRKLLQRMETGHYLKADGTWTTDCREAWDFPGGTVALLKGLEYDFPAQVVYCLNDPEKSLYIGVRKEDEIIPVCAYCSCHKQQNQQRTNT